MISKNAFIYNKVGIYSSICSIGRWINTCESYVYGCFFNRALSLSFSHLKRRVKEKRSRHDWLETSAKTPPPTTTNAAIAVVVLPAQIY